MCNYVDNKLCKKITKQKQRPHIKLPCVIYKSFTVVTEEKKLYKSAWFGICSHTACPNVLAIHHMSLRDSVSCITDNKGIYLDSI